MRLATDHPRLFSKLAAGEDLSPEENARFIEYLDDNPEAAEELEERVLELRCLVAPAEPSLVTVEVAEWDGIFNKVMRAVGGAAAIEAVAPDLFEESPEPTMPELVGAGVGAEEGRFGAGGWLLSGVFAVVMVFLLLSLDPPSTGSISAPPIIALDPRIEDGTIESESPIVIQDLRSGEDYNMIPVLPGSREDMFILWLEPVDETH